MIIGVSALVVVVVGVVVVVEIVVTGRIGTGPPCGVGARFDPPEQPVSTARLMPANAAAAAAAAAGLP